MSQTNDEISLVDISTIAWLNKWIILATTIVGGLIGYLWAKTSRPVYSVDALLQIETKDKKGFSNSLGAMADLFQTSNPAETEIEIIKSRLVLGQAAKRLGMEIYYSPEKWGRKERLLEIPIPRLELERLDVPAEMQGIPLTLTVFAGRTFVVHDDDGKELARGREGVGIDSSSNSSHLGILVRRIESFPGQKFTISHRSAISAVEDLSKALQVGEVGKKTGVIRLTFQGYDAKEAARTLNEIANSYVLQNVERKSAEAEKTLEFLQNQLPELKKQLETSEERLNQFRSSMGSVDLSEEARLALQEQVEVKQSIFTTQQKRKELLQHFEANHPRITTFDSAIANLEGKLNRQENQVKALPLQQQQIVRLMRDVAVNTELYTGLLNNSQQLRVVKAGEIGNVRIIDFAIPNGKPIKPNKRNIFILGILAGIVFGGSIGILRRLMIRGISDPSLIERQFGLSVFAQIPHSHLQKRLRKEVRQNKPGVHVLAHNSPDDFAIESIRSLRTSLDFALAGEKSKIIVISGPKENVGKSFVSQNIAIVFARGGKKVLLIDGDMRRGTIHSSFGIPRGQGFSEILADQTRMEQCANLPIKDLPLTVITSGTLPPNPSELLLSLRSNNFLQEWAEQYDIVIIDAPPVLAVTDAALLGQYANANLIVLKVGVHPAAEIEATLARLHQSGVDPKGMVINDIHLEKSKYVYSYKKTASK